MGYKQSAGLFDWAMLGIGGFFMRSDNIIAIDAYEGYVRIIASGKVAEAHAKDLIRQLEGKSFRRSRWG